MSLLKQLMKETASAGSTAAGSIAIAPLLLMQKPKKSMIRRITNTGTLFSGGQLTKHKFRRGGTLPKLRQLSESVVNDDDRTFDMSDVISKLDAAEKKAKVEKDTVTFGLEDDNGNIVRVCVRADQATDFETALAQLLTGNDDNDDDENSSTEIAEVLFKLKDQYDIVDVNWGHIPEDEEQEQTVQMKDEEAEGNDEKAATDEELSSDLSNLISDDKPDDSHAVSALQSVIDMMKADAEAKKAEADARTAEAKAKEAEWAAKAAEAKVKQEEEILDIETAEKETREMQKEAKRLAKLAKHRHDKAREAEVTLTKEEEEQGGSRIPYGNKKIYSRNQSLEQLRDAIFYHLKGQT